MARTVKILDPKYYCPECGHDILQGRSRQVCEDGCEMWYECAKCHYLPKNTDYVETVMDWDDLLRIYAYESWQVALDELRNQTESSDG